MILALWWYFWTQFQPVTGPALVRVSNHHFVVALAVAHAFAPAHHGPTALRPPTSSGLELLEPTDAGGQILHGQVAGEQVE
jgi:hypothetical protein